MPENAAPSPAIAPDALQPALDLQRTLLRRGALLVALLLLGLGLWSGQALGRAERAALPATARLVAQLLHQDLARQLSEVSCQPWTVEVNALSAVADRTAEQRRQAGGSRWGTSRNRP